MSTTYPPLQFGILFNLAGNVADILLLGPAVAGFALQRTVFCSANVTQIGSSLNQVGGKINQLTAKY